MRNRIAPSILSADFKRLGEQLKETEAACGASAQKEQEQGINSYKKKTEAFSENSLG